MTEGEPGSVSENGPLSTGILRANENLAMKDEQSADDSIFSSLSVVRQAWLDAVRDCDVERRGALVTDDVVVVHGNGRCVRGNLQAQISEISEILTADLC